jgi:Ca2+-binding EF-hand superfamily protein
MHKQIEKRLLRIFNVYDSDESGTITQSDAEYSLRRLAALRGYNKGTPEYESFREGFMIYWNDLLKGVDADENSEITVDEWLEYHENLLTDEHKAMQIILPFISTMFDIIDIDANGIISMDEYKNFMRAFGVLERWITDEVFRKLDLNKDGTISKKELGVLVREMYFNPDPSCPGNYLFGILT